MNNWDSILSRDQVSELRKRIKSLKPFPPGLCHICAAHDAAACLKFLISNGLKPNQVDSEGYHPLHIAVSHKSVNFINQFIRQLGKNVLSHSAPHIGTPLHLATQLQDAAMVHHLLQLGSNPNDNSPGFTALHIAIQSRNIPIVQALLDAGAKLNILDSRGVPPLHLPEANDVLPRIIKRPPPPTAHIPSSRSSSSSSLALLDTKVPEPKFCSTLSEKAQLIFKPSDNPEHKRYIDIGTDGQAVIHRIVSDNNFSLVEKYIANNLPLYPLTKIHHNSILHIAVEQNFFQIVKILVEIGFPISIVNKRLWTPLHIAVKKGLNQIVHYLCKHSSVVDLDAGVGSPLHVAAAESNLPAVQRLLQSGANINLQSKKKKNTPLMLAVLANDTNMVKFLLQRGANPLLLDSEDNSAVQYANLSKRSQAFQRIFAPFLQKAKRQLRLEKRHQKQAENASVKDLLKMEGLRLLPITDSRVGAHVAVLSQKYGDLRRSLIKCDINSRDPANHMTPLHYASLFGFPKMVKAVIQFGAKLDIPGPGGDTALHMAYTRNHTTVVEMLLEKGANPDIRNEMGQVPAQCAPETPEASETSTPSTPVNDNEPVQLNRSDTQMQMASYSTHSKNAIKSFEQAIKILSSSPREFFSALRSDPKGLAQYRSSVDPHGNSLLHIAVSLEKTDNIVEELLKIGFDPNQFNNLGYTCLHWAILHDNATVVPILLGRKANPDIETKSDDPLSALMLAIIFCPDSVQKLVPLSNLNTPALDGLNPLTLAIVTHNLALAELLLESGANPNADAKFKSHIALLHVIDPNFLELLIAQNINLALVIDSHGNTFAHQCVIQQRIDYLHLLCSLESNVPVTTKNHQGILPIHLAALLNRDECIQLLAPHSDLSACDSSGNSILHFAARYPFPENALKHIIHLVGSHVPLDKPNNKGITPLLVAVYYGNLDNIKTIVQFHKPQIIDKSDTLPLIHIVHSTASSNTKLEMAKYFIKELDHPLDYTDSEGTTALHYAVDSNEILLVDYFVSLDFPYVSDKNGLFPIDFVTLESAKSIHLLLRDYGPSESESSPSKE